MCGINGIVRLAEDLPPVDPAELRCTRDRMADRGPDGTGEWLSPDGRVALGHRRLAIIDLTAAGDQPMSYADGRYRIVHNGEMYNYRELRDELLAGGALFRSTSDTEVLLAMYERHGAQMLPRLRGMYAFAIWDAHERSLFLARDPYGIKPLYYADEGGTFRFASQVKALEEPGVLSKELDPGGLVGFLLWGSVPEPLTHRRSIRALPAGCYMLVSGERAGEPRRFARLSAGGPAEGPTPPAPAEAVAESVRYHLVSDVPVGAFLSAGIDSAVVTALAVRHLEAPPTTLTLRFAAYEGTPHDEGPLAAEVARALGTRHIEHRVGRDEFLDLWPRALAAMDQPSIDGFNTYLISKIARSYGLKVVLSGLGGDELFGGYPSFRDIPRWRRWARMGATVPGLAAAAGFIAGLRTNRPKAAGLFRYGRDTAGAYLLRRGLFLPEEIPGLVGEDLAAEGLSAYDPLADAARSTQAGPAAAGEDPEDWVQIHLLESGRYMRNQLLRDSDWASMAHSLELRVPLADAELQRQLAAHRFEPARSGGKAALFRPALPELPSALWTRPKTGFTVPVLNLLEDQRGPFEKSPGLDSRRLALRVLEEFGAGLSDRGLR